ncbi:hypothetical protein D3C85_1410600 [compost metagenome]
MPHPQRIARDAAPGVRAHLDDAQHPVDLARRQAQQTPAQIQVLAPRQIAVEAVGLQQGPDLARRAHAVAGDVNPVDPRRSGGRTDQPQQHLQRRRLACAVATQEAVDGLIRDGHRHRLDHRSRTETPRQLLRLYHSGHDRSLHFV